MRANLYVHTDLQSETTLVWRKFFEEHLPNWQVSYRFAEQILDEDPKHIIFPGGSGSAFYRKLGEERSSQIVEWVRDGGSYIGVCAGAYLAASHLKITPLVIPDTAWKRGLHETELSLAECPIFRVHERVNYHNGPVFSDADNVEVWARFQSNYLAEGGFYPMKGSPAICRNSFGKGSVFLLSPHLEKTDDSARKVLAEYFEYVDLHRAS
jgi:glutamine amidotransferase-like uncharacterized protein